MVTASAFLSAFVLSLLTFTFDNISELPGLETWAVWMVVSHQVVDFEHRHPHSRDLSEQLLRVLTSFEGVHLRHRSSAEVASV